METALSLAENGLLPDSVIKFGIRKLLGQRLQEIPTSNPQEILDYKIKLIEDLKRSKIAIETKAANDQHYEVPAQFFKLALGTHLKYSSAYYENGAKTLNQAEHDMLALSADRAGIKDGMTVMDLGCGWGSMTLWLAKHFPNCKIYSVSNSHQQREYIEAEAKKHNLSGIQVITADINEFDFEHKGALDRIISIEMFEHMRNYQELLKKISTWLSPEGKMFVHIFCHKTTPYYFESEGEDNWMGAYFFTGGIMPSLDLFQYFQDHLKLKSQWKVNGANYQKTSLAWLENMDRNRDEIMKLFAGTYGKKDAKRWFHRWRIFFLSCAELFGYEHGEEWFVNHYLFEKKIS